MLIQLKKHCKNRTSKFCEGYSEAINDVKFVKEQLEIQKDFDKKQ